MGRLRATYLSSEKQYTRKMRTKPLREWFFYTDFKGLLHFEEEPHLQQRQSFTIATAIKDKRFLNQFYKNLQRLEGPLKYDRYPFVSDCWGEWNYLRVDVSPVVYNNLDLQTGDLSFSYQQSQKFNPSALRVDSRGYILHPFKEGIDGVFGSDLICDLSDRLSYDITGNAELKLGDITHRILKAS